mmetsp:Transcript_67949/g.221181  ORF Transcript_67949/g.221181 Transcript_67949/m.221181 type:complete len:259 (-) Transcript_67949:2628-3404(-)
MSNTTSFVKASVAAKCIDGADVGSGWPSSPLLPCRVSSSAPLPDAAGPSACARCTACSQQTRKKSSLLWSLCMKPREAMCWMSTWLPARPLFCKLSGAALYMLDHSSNILTMASRVAAVSAMSPPAARARASSSRRAAISAGTVIFVLPGAGASRVCNSSSSFATASTSCASCKDMPCWNCLPLETSRSSTSMVCVQWAADKTRCLKHMRCNNTTAKSNAGALTVLYASRCRGSNHFSNNRSNSLMLMSWYRKSPETT